MKMTDLGSLVVQGVTILSIVRYIVGNLDLP